MKKLSFSKNDIKFHFKENKTLYFMLFLCTAVGIVVGFVLVFSSTHFVNLLTSSNKSLYTFINGTADYMGLFWKKFMSFLVPIILIFVLSLNYYLWCISYLFITYQSALFVLSCAALIKMYTVSGFFNVMFIMLPINAVFFAVMFYMIVVCGKRSRCAHKYKTFAYGLDNNFLVKVGACVLVLLLLALLACVIYPIFLRSSVFIIF